MFHFESWAFCGGPRSGNQAFFQHNGLAPGIWLYYTADGHLQLSVLRQEDFDPGDVVNVVGPQIPGPPAWHYIAIKCQFGLSSATIAFRVDNASTSTTESMPTPPGALPQITEVHVNPMLSAPLGAIEAIQLTHEPLSAPFNDDFVPSAILDRSLNRLTATPKVLNRSLPEVLREVVEAEQGTLDFLEDGTARFRNRRAAVGTGTSLLLHARTNITSLSAEESADTVRNIIRVPAAPLALTPHKAIWGLAEVVRVPARRTLTLWPQFEGSIYQLDTTVIRYPDGSSTAESGYRAARQPDGQGGSVTGLSFAVTAFVDTAKIVVSNPNTFDAYLVHPTGAATDAGTPALTLFGRLISPLAAIVDSTDTTSAGYLAEASDPASIDSYDARSLEIDDNPFRQSTDAANSLAKTLLGQLKRPRPVLRDVGIVPDPRIQLGDRARVVDPDGLALDAEFLVIGNRVRFDESGFEQTVTLRDNPSVWRLGDTTYSRLGATTRLA